MKSAVLRKMSNPKKPEEYLKMFTKLKKYSLDFMKSIENDANFNLKNLLRDYSNDMAFSDYINLALNFSKNDRVESYLKFLRAKLCHSWITECKKYPKESVELLKYCESEVSKYLNSVERTESEKRSNDTLTVGDETRNLMHFEDLYNTDKNKYRAINDYSWANKSPAKIIYDLSEIEDEIDSKKVKTKREYDEKLKEAENTIEYLKVNNKYTWYVIESNSCSFEAYLNDHCGTDRSADVLFSLRSQENGMFDSHVTISASIKTVDEKQFKVPAIFIVKQVKGKGNNTPNSRYWPYIVDLFLSEEFGYQTNSGYRSEDDFHISLLDDKAQADFKKVKPYWDSEFKALKHFDLMKNNQAFTPKFWGADNAYFDDKDNFIIEYPSLVPMLEGLGKHWGGREDYLVKTAKHIDDYVDAYDMELDDDNLKEFLDYIKETHKPLYIKLEELAKTHDCSVEELVGDYRRNKNESLAQDVYRAIESAYITGWEVGTEHSKYHSYVEFYDGHEFGIGEIRKFDNKFIVEIYAQDINEYCEENNELAIPDPDEDYFNHDRGRFSVGYEWDYDSSAAYERLEDELPE